MYFLLSGHFYTDPSYLEKEEDFREALAPSSSSYSKTHNRQKKPANGSSILEGSQLLAGGGALDEQGHIHNREEALIKTVVGETADGVFGNTFCALRVSVFIL